MTITINRTPAKQVDLPEDLFCCTKEKKKKSNTQEKKLHLQTVKTCFHVNVLYLIVSIQCSCAGETKVVLLWSQVHCVTGICSQQPYSEERCVQKHFGNCGGVLSNKDVLY